jgi:hypothetical protein
LEFTHFLKHYRRISICGVKAPFYTKLKIKPQYWDQETKRGKGRSKEIPRINLALSKLETEITEAYEKIRERRKKVDPFYLRDYLQGGKSTQSSPLNSQ